MDEILPASGIGVEEEIRTLGKSAKGYLGDARKGRGRGFYKERLFSKT